MLLLLLLDFLQRLNVMKSSSSNINNVDTSQLISGPTCVDSSPFHLFVGCTMKESQVFRDVNIDHPWQQSLLLPRSNNHDAVTCCHVADMDFDGTQELILGTYGQYLMIYRYGKFLLRLIEFQSPGVGMGE